MRLHLLGQPNMQFTAAYRSNGFARIAMDFARMMTERGHQVFVYGAGVCAVPCVEFIQCLTVEQQASFFAKGAPLNENPRSAYWQRFNTLAAKGIQERQQKGDLLCVTYGSCQDAVVDAVSIPAVEIAVGYQGTSSKTHKVFASHAWRHYCYGKEQRITGRETDRVIPHFFDKDEFPLGKGAGDYLYVGRMSRSKGVHLAAAAALAAGHRLLMVGTGGVQHDDGLVEFEGIKVRGGHYLGHVDDNEERNRLFGAAPAALLLTQYVGPFESTHVEAMLCGTPVITSDWGAFTETVTPQVGFRCNSMDDVVKAIRMAPVLDRARIRAHAVQRFSFEAVAPQYERYLESLCA